MKLVDWNYLALTQVKVLNENSYSGERQQYTLVEGSILEKEKASLAILPKVFSPQYNNKGNCKELGRTRLFSEG